VTAEIGEDTLLLWAPLLPPEQVLVLFESAAEIPRRIPRVVWSLFPPRPLRGAHEGAGSRAAGLTGRPA
jgi:hypothetical protein